MLKIWQYNRNTDSKKVKQVYVCVDPSTQTYTSYSHKTDFTHYGSKFKKYFIKTMSCCYSLTMLIQQYAEVVNYNLMWRNSDNTSGWPENLKSGQIVRETPAPDVIFWIPPSGFYFLPYESLHGAIQFAVSASVRSRRTNRMPHLDIWNRAPLFTSLFHFCRIRMPHTAYMVSRLKETSHHHGYLESIRMVTLRSASDYSNRRSQ